MAMQDPILFTGKELNFEIPKFTELNAAEDNLRKKIQREEDTQERLQKEFRDNMNVDLETFTSTYSMKQQAELAKAFTDKYTKRAKENGGKLTNEDLVEMKADQTALATRQKEWLSSQALWAQDSKLVQQSPADFDKEKFAADTKNFLETGIYNPNSLEFSGINMADYFENEKWTGATTEARETVENKGGFDIYKTTTVNATPEEAKRHILQTILGDTTGRALKGVVKDFQSEPENIKYKYLSEYDTDKSGTISEAEMGNVKLTSMNILENPILRYAQEKYLPNVAKTKFNTDIKRAPRGTGAGAERVEPFTAPWAQQVLWSDKIKNIPFVDDFLYQKRQRRVVADGTTIYAEDAPGQAVNIGNAREAKWIADYMNDPKNFKAPAGAEDAAVLVGDKYDFSDISADVEVGGEKIDILEPPRGVRGNSKIRTVKVLSYDDNKKEITLSVENNKDKYSKTIKIADLESMPQVIKDAVFGLKINTPTGVTTIMAGGQKPATNNKWSAYKE